GQGVFHVSYGRKQLVGVRAVQLCVDGVARSCLSKICSDAAVNLSAEDLASERAELDDTVVEVDIRVHIGELRAIVNQCADCDGAAAGSRVKKTRLRCGGRLGGGHETPR